MGGKANDRVWAEQLPGLDQRHILLAQVRAIVAKLVGKHRVVVQNKPKPGGIGSSKIAGIPSRFCLGCALAAQLHQGYPELGECLRRAFQELFPLARRLRQKAHIEYWIERREPRNRHRNTVFCLKVTGWPSAFHRTAETTPKRRTAHLENVTQDAGNGLRFRGYIPALDVLRGIAVASVVIFHAFFGTAAFTLPPGAARQFTLLTIVFGNGVPLFFVLSGFLISGILLDSENKPRYYRNFYIRRALRILPAYLLILIVLKSDHFISWRFVFAALLYIANMASLVGAHTNEYGVLWSLAVEEQFYLIWPILLRHVRKENLLRLCLAACLLLPLSRIAMTLMHVDAYTNLVANADYLLFGAMVAIGLRLGMLNARNIRGIYRTLGFSALLSLVPYLYIDQLQLSAVWPNAFRNAYGRIVPVMFFVSFLLYAVAHNQGKPLKGVTTRFFAFLGYLSYGLYLVHPLIFELYDRWTAGTRFGQGRTDFAMLVLRALTAACIATAIAYLSRRFFEERFLHLKATLTPSMSKQETQALDQTPV
jgi:peptidoglycan/LPS O-acetylase OafA/YrhL